MKFSIYDILSNLIPGFLILFALSVLLDYSLEGLDIATSIVIAYIVGYVNNTFSSWAEDLFNWSWGGKPSDQLLNGKIIWKVKFYEYLKVKEQLINESTTETPTNDNLFQIAMRYVNSSTNERVKDFNSNYALSRNLIISFLVTAIVINIRFWFNYWIFVLSIILVIVVWLRAKQRGFYFAREVLSTYMNIKSKEILDHK